MSETNRGESKANIFKSMDNISLESREISHECGVTMNDSVEARAIAEYMDEQEGVVVTYMPAMIRIDGVGQLEFNMPAISEILGKEMTAETFEVNTSTHYGRMIRVDDDIVVLFGNMDEALKYIEN